MGRARRVYALLLAAALGLWMFYWDYVAYLLLAVLAAVPLMLWGLTWLTAACVRIRFEEAQPLVLRGQAGTFGIRAQNLCFFCAPAVRLTISLRHSPAGISRREVFVFPLDGRSDQRLTADICAEHCGNAELCLERVSVYDFLGLTCAVRPLRKQKSSRIRVCFFPETFPLEPALNVQFREDPEGQRYDPWRYGSDPSQTVDYHEYREGEEMKRVHWKLSAKLDRVMLRDLASPASNPICIWVEKDCPPGCGDGWAGRMDMVFSALVSVSMRLLEQETAHGIRWYSPAEGHAVECEVRRQEDLLAALRRLFAEGGYERPLLLEEANASSGAAMAGVIYGAPGEAGAYLPGLTELAVRTRVTACLICPPEGPPPPGHTGDAQVTGLSVVWLREEDLEGSLREISF